MDGCLRMGMCTLLALHIIAEVDGKREGLEEWKVKGSE